MITSERSTPSVCQFFVCSHCPAIASVFFKAPRQHPIFKAAIVLDSKTTMKNVAFTLAVLGLLCTSVSARVMLQDDSDYDDNDAGLLTVSAPDSLDVPVYYYVEQGNGPAMSPADFMNTVISELSPTVGGRQIVFAPASAPLAGAPDEAVVLFAGRRLSQASPSPAVNLPTLEMVKSLTPVPAPSACLTLSEVLADAQLSQFVALAQLANFTSRVTQLGSNYTLLLPNNAAVSAVQNSPAALALVQNTTLLQQAVSQQIIKGDWTLANLMNNDKLETLDAKSPLTVVKSGNTTSLKTSSGSSAHVLESIPTCTVDILIVDSILSSDSSMSVQG